MKAKYSFTPSSLAHCASSVSFWLLDEIRPMALSRPAGSRNEIDEAEVSTEQHVRLPVDLRDTLDHLRGELAEHDAEHDVGAEAFSVASCEPMVGADVS